MASCTIGDYTVIDHVISHVTCFNILIVSKMASSSARTSSDYPAELKATFGDQQGQTLQDYVETSLMLQFNKR